MVIIVLISVGLGVRFATGPLGVVVIVMVATAFSVILSGLSLSLAAVIKSHETLMAVVNFLTLPLMFASSALFPRQAMPTGWQRSLRSTR
ncbi:MAG: ABC transporter permease [Candidatus Bipolaricaulaceae bacterium]